MSGGDAEDLLIAHLGFLGVRTRSGSRENPLQDQPSQRPVEPLETEGR